MPVAIRAATRIQDADDINVSLGAGVDEYALCWDNDTAKFVLRAPAAPFAGILATGATVGATAQAQAFTLGVVSPFVAPAADSTTAWQVRKADKTTAVFTVDTTNGYVGIGTIAPSVSLHVAKSGLTYGLWQSTDGAGDFLAFFASSSFGPAIYWKQSNALRFIRSNNETGTSVVGEVARFSADSFFGIGTTAPATRLDIDAGAMTMAEMTAPTGVANKAMLYTKDNGSGKTQLCCKLGDDVEIVIATQA